MGYQLTLKLAEVGYNVTVLNRGQSRVNLPESVSRLRADRTDHQQMKRALMARRFDVVVDFVLFNGREAEMAVELLRDITDHYICISTGQVYLVREGIERPFREEEYEGRVMPSPKQNTYAYEEWRYGTLKREAEDVLIAAHAASGFPYTTLRLPMVNSENDPFKRLYSYIIRLKDGGPILVPETPNYPLRHIYGGDVVRALMQLIATGAGKGRAFNLAQEETVSIDEFVGILGELLSIEPQILRFKRSELDANGFLPDCSPFSERWMSELDNTRSKTELKMHYTPLREYLARLVTHYQKNRPPVPVGYKRRQAELHMVEGVR